MAKATDDLPCSPRVIDPLARSFALDFAAAAACEIDPQRTGEVAPMCNGITWLIIVLLAGAVFGATLGVLFAGVLQMNKGDTQ